jgi:histone arginine demethylase JMJD6
MNATLLLTQHPAVDRRPTIDGPTFGQAYGNGQKPLVLTHMAADWPLLTRWTEAYLTERFGEVYQKSYRTVGGHKEGLAFRLADYLAYMHAPPEQPPFYLTNCQFHLHTDLETHYAPPPFFRCWYRSLPPNQRRYTLSWVFVGAAHTGSKLHTDVFNSSAWNVVVSGQKMWLFFPPEQASYLYDGAVDPFAPDLRQFPAFAQTRPLVCLQQPGEVVYTPSGWWHAVYNLTPGLSLTENFINESNYRQVLNYLRDRNTGSYQFIRQLVDKNLSPCTL